MIEGGVALWGYEDDDRVGRLGVPGFNSLIPLHGPTSGR